MNEIEHREWNEKMAHRFNPDDFINKSGTIIRWVEKRRLDLTHREINPNLNSEILDVGCGAGNLLEKLIGKRIIGIDLSEFLLGIARERLRGNNIELIVGAAENLPFPDNSFDKVVCSEVLEHVLSPESVIVEIHRICKKDGELILTIPNEKLINFSKRCVLIFGLKKWVAKSYPMSDDMLDEWHLSDFNPEDIIKITEKYFSLVRVVSVPFSFIPYHRIYVFRKK